MARSPASATPPPRFVEALESIRRASFPPEVELEEIPAPMRPAPFAVALEARLPRDEESDAASGSFVLLHEPEGHVVWDGDFRIVTVAKAELEPEFALDPFVAAVAWTYLVEALDQESLPRAELAGTATRTVSESFGSIKSRGTTVGVEIRASWTPEGAEIGAQLVAWLRFLAKLGGMELTPPGVTVLRGAR
ncbi:MAG: DUF3000 domain-containing protein [Bifidobacteriaceae bacterium]|jgi:hypothetical protein|nr:DUF3000 domain-containing protein [Bifidobacteriaceae bacterium]